MNLIFDGEQLEHLLTSLYTLTGISAVLFDSTGTMVCSGTPLPAFCTQIQSSQAGQARCHACCMNRIRAYDSAAVPQLCHAGVWEVTLPIVIGGIPTAYLVVGQMLRDTSLDEQWNIAAPLLSWYKGNREDLQNAFRTLRRCTEAEWTACSVIGEAVCAYIQSRELIRAYDLTDIQKLDRYLEEHLSEKLSLERIASDLDLGRTKLCLLAKTLSGGKSLSPLIAQRRVDAAKKLLLHTNDPISVIAEAVGISDYNYFTKVFRTATGMTPSVFRKTCRQPETS